MDLTGTRQYVTLDETQAFSPDASTMITAMGEIVNWILDNVLGYSVGSIIQTMLTESEMQAIVGTGFVLANGQSCVGSTFETLTGNSTVPDLRAAFIRGKNNGRSDGNENPAGDLALGTLTAQTLNTHGHTTSVSTNVGSLATPLTIPSGLAGAYGVGNLNALSSSISVSIGGPNNVGSGTDVDNVSTVNSEFRPRSTIMNFFIRIN